MFGSPAAILNLRPEFSIKSGPNFLGFFGRIKIATWSKYLTTQNERKPLDSRDETRNSLCCGEELEESRENYPNNFLRLWPPLAIE